MNRVREEMEGPAAAFDAVDGGAVLGTEGRWGMRCCSSTTIHISLRAQIANKKNTPN